MAGAVGVKMRATSPPALPRVGGSLAKAHKLLVNATVLLQFHYRITNR